MQGDYLKHNILLKTILLFAILVFSFYVSAESLTDTITEPVEPVGSNQDFLLRVSSTLDANTWGTPQLVESFEFDTVGADASSWDSQFTTGLGCSGFNDNVFANGTSTASGVTDLNCSLGNQCVEMRANSCNGADNITYFCSAGKAPIDTTYCSSISYDLSAAGGIATSTPDVNFLLSTNDLNITWFKSFGGWQRVLGFYWKADQTFNVNDRVIFDVNGAMGGINHWVYLDNFRISSVSTSSEVIQGDCNASLNGAAFQPMTYSAANQWNSITLTSPLTAGDYNAAIYCEYTNPDTGVTSSDYDEFTITVAVQEYEYLTFTPIENVGSWNYGSIEVYPADEAEQIIWRVDSNSVVTQSPQYIIHNSRNDGRQYFVYTANQANYDDGNWAFDDTLTFGSNTSNPLQKIWNESTDKYDYSFIDTLTATETKYYKLTYRSPHKHYSTLYNESEWLVQNTPNLITDINTVPYDEYSVSSFAGIRNVLVQHVPDVFDDETAAFEFQFTARSDVNGTTLDAGTVINGTQQSVQQVSLTSTWHTYSFTITATDFDSQLLMVSSHSSPSNIYVRDYAIVARGFFTKRLSMLKSNGNPLDAMLIGGFSNQFMQEGDNFRVSTEAYDREGNLNRLELFGYFISVTPTNQAKKITKFIYDDDTLASNKEENRVNFDGVNFPPIIDLNGNFNNNPTRDLFIVATIYDDNNKAVSTQSQLVKFLQYPYFPDDLIMQFYPTETRFGNNPAGVLDITVKEPSTLLGFDLRIYSDANTVTSPNYRTYFYNDNDFSCNTTRCSLQINIDDFVLEDINLSTITVFALLNTEYLDTSNRLTRVDRRFFVSPITFKIAKIHQVVERLDDVYVPEEQIPLVLILQDTEATNTKDKLDIYLTLENCDGNTITDNCVQQTTQFKPTGFLYDDQFNLNYYFFQHLFILDNGSLLPDGNYIGFRANITDATGARTIVTPILASKCQSKDWVASLINNVIGALASVVGLVDVYGQTSQYCNTAQYPLVTLTDNNSEVERLQITQNHSRSAPSQEVLLCVTPDSNNVLGEPFKQNIYCYLGYTVGEKPIDDFRFRLTNQYSDLTNDDTTKQYVEYNIPYELIAYNDVQLLANELETNQNTTISTWGQFIFEGFRNIVKTNYQLYNLEDYAEFSTKNGIIQNAGVDINFNQAFSPAFVNGGMFIVIEGVPIINAQEFKNNLTIRDNFDNINRSDFLNYLAENNVKWSVSESSALAYVSSFALPYPLTDDGALIIDEEPQKVAVNRGNLDANAAQNVKYNYLPTTIPITFSSTMFYNNFSENSVLSAIIHLVAVIKGYALNELLDFVSDFGSDPAGALVGVLFQNIVFLALILGLLVVFSILYANFRDRGG